MSAQEQRDDKSYYEAQTCLRLACTSVALSRAPPPMRYPLHMRIVDLAFERHSPSITVCGPDIVPKLAVKELIKAPFCATLVNREGLLKGFLI